MKVYIALLRGINVGGHRKVPMATLRTILASAGLYNVKTYIQSGNVVFISNEHQTHLLEEKIQKTIFDYFGFQISVMVKSIAQFTTIFNNSPFSDEIKRNSHFAVLSDIPKIHLIKEACQKKYDNEYYHIIADCLYFYCASGYGKAKFNLNYFERKLKVSATARNYKTMLKLIGMAKESESML